MAALAVLNEGSGPMKQSKSSQERIIYPFGRPKRTPASDCDRQLSAAVRSASMPGKRSMPTWGSGLHPFLRWKKSSRLIADLSLDKYLGQRLTRKRSMACELFAGKF